MTLLSTINSLYDTLQQKREAQCDTECTLSVCHVQIQQGSENARARQDVQLCVLAGGSKQLLSKWRTRVNFTAGDGSGFRSQTQGMYVQHE